MPDAVCTPAPVSCPHLTEIGMVRDLYAVMHGDGKVDGKKGVVEMVQYLVDRERARERRAAVLWKVCGGGVIAFFAAAILVLLPSVFRFCTMIAEKLKDAKLGQ